MAKTTTAPFTQSFRTDVLTLTNSNGFIPANAGTTPTNVTKLIDAGPDGSILKSILISSNDSSNQNVAFYISKNNGSTDFLLFTVPVPSSAGFNGTVSNVDVLGSTVVAGTPIDQSGRPVMLLSSGDSIFVGVTTTAVTASRNIYISTQTEDF